MLLLLFCILPLLVHSFSSYTPESMPDSMSQAEQCGILVPGLICDPSFQLKEGNITINHELLEQKLALVRYNTSCACAASDSNLGECLGGRGFTVSIAVIEKMVLDEDQHDRRSRMRAAETFAERLRLRFPRGQCDDDVFILYSTKDSAIWTSLGVVSQRYLTPELINSVTLKAEEYFVKGQYTEGLGYMVDSYRDVFNGKPLEIANNDGWYWPIPLWSIIVIAAILSILLLGSVVCCICCCVKKCCCQDRHAQYNVVSQNQTSRL